MPTIKGIIREIYELNPGPKRSFVFRQDNEPHSSIFICNSDSTVNVLNRHAGSIGIVSGLNIPAYLDVRFVTKGKKDYRYANSISVINGQETNIRNQPQNIQHHSAKSIDFTLYNAIKNCIEKYGNSAQSILTATLDKVNKDLFPEQYAPKANIKNTLPANPEVKISNYSVPKLPPTDEEKFSDSMGQCPADLQSMADNMDNDNDKNSLVKKFGLDF